MEELSLDTLIKDKSKVHSTMITSPKLTAVLVAMTALVGTGPVAAFAQLELDLDLDTGDVDQEAVANTGANEIDSVTVGNQEASNTIAVVQENNANNEGGDANAEAESEAEAEAGKKGKAYAESGDAFAFARGGDVDNEQTNVAVVTDNEQTIDQDQDVESENEIETGDAETNQIGQTGILDIAAILDDLEIGL